MDSIQSFPILFSSLVNDQKQHSIKQPSFLTIMTIGESEPNPTITDPILTLLEGYHPSFFDDSYDTSIISNSNWWFHFQDEDFGQVLNNSSIICNSFNSDTFPITAPINATTPHDSHHPNGSSTTITAAANPPDPVISGDSPSQSDPSKKRKSHDVPNSRDNNNPNNSRKNQGRRIRDEETVTEQGVAVTRTIGSKRTKGKLTGNVCKNGDGKDGRWAEQLLNPCAAAITSGDLSRVHHLFCVINELGSLTGDPNHRLAWHGLRALARQASHGALTFASAESKFFMKTLIDFNDISPWFRIPNDIANSSILQILSEQDKPSNLHILDVGVSHGVQWPTLLEELSRLSGGPPPLVRITVVPPTADGDQSSEIPFAVAPPGYDFSPNLLGFSKEMNINLHINILENQSLENLNDRVIGSRSDETLIICAQFRLHQLNHNTPNNRREFLRVMRGLEPKGVILSENDVECSCSSCGNFATRFSRKVEQVWKFLDSTSTAFKGRESEERRMMEGEAAKALRNAAGEMNERKEKWCRRMREAGFAGEVLGEDTIDGARALLRKYDNNWEIRTEGSDRCVGLWWKGHPVSFCSLWKLDPNANG